MRLKTKIITGVTVAAVVALGWFGYQQALPTAMVGKVVRGTAVRAVPANVTVSAESTMEIKSEQGGRIIKRLVKKGQEVKEGERMFEIDSKDLELEIEKIEADQKAAKARIDLGSPTRFEIATAEENVKNSTRMLEAGRLAQVEFDRVKRSLEVLKDKKANEDITNQQMLDTFENTLKLKRRALEKMHVIAPDDGTVIDLSVEPGALVSAGQVLARVISRARQVEAQISEENFAGVRPGLPVAVQFLVYYGKRFTGKVERVLPSADEKTKRYTAFLNLDIPIEQLAPGITGEASITVDQHENALLVAQRSVVGVNNSKVYLVQSGHVRFTPVALGFVGQNVAEISSGIKEGDFVVLDELSTFKNGQRVRMVEDQQN
jgi:RND family efflux transporter MFP subunit